jgi:YidC/Oxa1 family membrane protein insertase
MMMPTFTGGARYDDEDVYHKYKFDEFSDDNDATSKGGWIGMVEHYFLSAWIPNSQSSHKYSSKVYDDLYMMQAVNPPQSIAPGQTLNIPGNNLFVGPKLQNVIENAAVGMDHTVDYSWLYIVAKPMSELMHWINKYVNSWGWTIIIFTILIKLVFYKLSEKSYRNMAAMKLLAPRINQLKETYGDDKQKFGQKTMELYRKEKVNPAAGCLPILVQIPVFISLYWVLLEMVELRQTPFLYLNDLADMDQFFILPIIMVISMIVQQKLNPPPTDPTQAKIMMALPYVFGVFFLWFPSGLVLYWVANNILSILQQWVINKRISG